jgi:hypothetical protein
MLAHFASCAGKAKKSQNKPLRFAKRNESFRDDGRKSLKSLMAPNHDFAESFVFNGLSPVSFPSFLASALSTPQTPNLAARTAPRQPRRAFDWLSEGLGKQEPFRKADSPGSPR